MVALLTNGCACDVCTPLGTGGSLPHDQPGKAAAPRLQWGVGVLDAHTCLPCSPFLQSIFTLGAAAGGLSAMVLNDLLGRKLSIMFSAVPSAAGYALMAGAHGFWMLLLGRTLTGFAGGLTAACIPVRPGLPIPALSLPQHCAEHGCCSLPATPGLRPPWAVGICLPGNLSFPAAGQLICPHIPSQPHAGPLQVPTPFPDTQSHCSTEENLC